MRIAQIAPLYESVPPKLYGGTERVVSYLTEELVRQGHEVTLFASGDSQTNANLVPGCAAALRLGGARDTMAPHIKLLEDVFRSVDEFDVIHFHIDYLHFPLTRRHQIAAVTTLHGRLDLPELVPIYREYPDMHLVSISDAQRQPISWANWVATVHHGLPDHLYRVHDGNDRKYLAFVGRIAPEKRVDRAIEIAIAAGMPLKIAAKVDDADRKYFEREIAHLLDHPLIEMIGEIAENDKDEFLGNAHALLFPIDWPEPFGLVMIEAMACGAPVIAYPHGSVPEIIDDGETGFLITSTDQAVSALERIDSRCRRRCREVFDRYFTAARMATDYVRVYETLISRAAGKRAASVNQELLSAVA